MEKTLNPDQKITLFNELTQGRELVKQLRLHLDPSSSSTGEVIISKLLFSFDESLLMLNSVKLEAEPQCSRPMATTAPESPRSISGSPRSSYDSDQYKSKKRKIAPKWTEQVRGCPRMGLEGPLDDGYSWRKYGQKDIHGTKYPRGYFRCTYRNAQECQAIKQVQRSDEDPTIFRVTYQGRHTCIQASYLIPGQPTNKQNQDRIQKKSQETFINFQTKSEVKKENLDSQDLSSSNFSFTSTSHIDGFEKQNHNFSSLSPDNNFIGSFSPPTISPTSSESNYLSPYGMNSFGGQNLQTLESDINESISASTSSSNSPILDLDMDFSLDLDSQYFPFESPSFFS